MSTREEWRAQQIAHYEANDGASRDSRDRLVELRSQLCCVSLKEGVLHLEDGAPAYCRLVPATFAEGLYLGPVLRCAPHEEIVFHGQCPSPAAAAPGAVILLHECAGVDDRGDRGFAVECPPGVVHAFAAAGAAARDAWRDAIRAALSRHNDILRRLPPSGGPRQAAVAQRRRAPSQRWA